MNVNNDDDFFSFAAFIRHNLSIIGYTPLLITLSKITDDLYEAQSIDGNWQVCKVFQLNVIGEQGNGRYVNKQSVLRDTPQARDMVYEMILKHDVQGLTQYSQVQQLPIDNIKENKTDGNV